MTTPYRIGSKRAKAETEPLSLDALRHRVRGFNGDRYSQDVHFTHAKSTLRQSTYMPTTETRSPEMLALVTSVGLRQ